MGKITGFMEIERETPQPRPVAERVKDWQELYQPFSLDRLCHQAARCMDCGIPFCHSGCHLNNLIPIWNDWVYRQQWQQAVDALHSTNNFPEFTGRVCPAPCESSCVLGLNREAVTIRYIEKTIADEGFKRGLIHPQPALKQSGKRVAVVGSGPAGMAASQQLARAGHAVVLFEKQPQAGGLLRYGIPDFKLEKWVIDRRLKQLQDEGVTIRTGVHVGIDLVASQLMAEFDAVLLAGGSEQPRDLPLPGRELTGIHFAMDFLVQQNRRLEGVVIPDDRQIVATGKRVVVIGGGDTGADCVGTSVRQGALHITQIELLPRPPKERSLETPWPMWPHTVRTSTSHEEGCRRLWSILTKCFEGNAAGQVQAVRCAELAWSEPEEGGPMQMRELSGNHFVLEADLVLLAMGFVHPVHQGLITDLGVALDGRGNVRVDHHGMTSRPGLFAAGDMAMGQSLVLKAIMSGRQVAAAMDRWLRQEAC
ncbi:MAG: glutamate synthase subunit beta [Magnetococcales bacterium]|nr:glutamate synthase subunit beta [Magnetococcales bacterium]